MENKEKWEKIAEMKGLKLNQEFKINNFDYSDNIYKITENGIIWRHFALTGWNPTYQISIDNLLFKYPIEIIPEYENWFPEFDKVFYCVDITNTEGVMLPKGIMNCKVKHMGKEEKWLKEMKKLRLIFPTVEQAQERYKEIIEKIK